MGTLTFLDMKRRDLGAELAAQNKKITELSKMGDYEKDARFWRPVIDKSNTGGAIIRFLPQPPQDGDDGLPFVRKWTHGFKSPKTGKWYIENSRTTMNGEADPVTDYNRTLWGPDKECIKENKKQVDAQKRKLRYISNIMVLRHDARPEDVGNVYLYAYGQTIFDKIKDAGAPPESDIDPVNVFNFYEGANFRLRIRDKDGWVNYETSVFDPTSVIGPLGEKHFSDEQIEALWNKQHSLAAEVSPDKFQPYDELQAKLNEVLGLSKARGEVAPDAIYNVKSSEANLPKVTSPSIVPAAGETVGGGDADLEEAKFFARIAAQRKTQEGAA